MEPQNLKPGETSSVPGLFKSMKAKFGMTSGKSKSHDNMASTSTSAKGSSGYGDLGNATIPSQQGVTEGNRNLEIQEHQSHHFQVQQSRQTMSQEYKGTLCGKVTRRNTVVQPSRLVFFFFGCFILRHFRWDGDGNCTTGHSLLVAFEEYDPIIIFISLLSFCWSLSD